MPAAASSSCYPEKPHPYLKTPRTSLPRYSGSSMSSAEPGKALLIHFSGRNRPGMAAELTSALASQRIGILDIGQAIVHETVSLAILVELPSADRIAPLKAVLTERARELHLDARFT